ncbi:MAG: hypothetical protein ACYSUN_11955 [Planctomycetota bacterium]|jgi:hypothetical protein
MRTAFASLGICLLLSTAAFAADEDADWPRILTVDGNVRLVLHQPQVQSWKGFQALDVILVATIEIPEEGGEIEEAIGTVRLKMKTTLDHAREIAVVEEPEVVEVRFLTLDDDGLKKVREVIAKAARVGTREIQIADLIAAVGPAPGEEKTVEIRTEPPKVIFSRELAILVVFDGEPVFEPIEGTDLLLALNTPSLLFQHAKTGWLYMYGWDSWIKARDHKSRWVASPQLPSAFRKLPDKDIWSELKKNIPGRPLKDEDLPKVHVATEPTELVVTFGEPTFKPIEGTSLTWVDNTEGDIFLNAKDGLYYVLLSGRWYRTRGKDHPLEFCTNDLPGDFRKISPEHEAGRVLASVPGTSEAEIALTSNLLPRQAVVKRGEVDLKVTYLGAPRFEPIEGTKVAFATNTSLDVLRVGDGYHCCAAGVWFSAGSPQGPWKLSERVPAEIYTVPSRHPLYSVTFVKVANATSEEVTYSYTAGYFGSYAHGGVVVWGTGWDHTWSVENWRHGWQNRHYWLEELYNDALHQWHRSLTYGQGRWYDHLTGIYRVSHDAMSHAKVRVHRGQAYRSWRGKAVLPAVSRRAPEPEKPAKKKKPTRVAKSSADLYAGADGKVYKRSHGSWYRQKADGSWIHLSGRPTLQKDVDRRKKLDEARRAREESKNRKRYNGYRYGRGRRGMAWYARRGWWGGGGGLGAVNLPARGFGGGGAGLGGGVAIGGW